MAKLKQASAPYAPKPSLGWRIYPMAWCLIGIGSGAYVLTSDTSAHLASALGSDDRVVERRIADAETRATTAARTLERAKVELREERGRVVALNARIDELTSDLRSANAARFRNEGATTAPGAASPTKAVTRQVPSPVVTTTIVNTTPVTTPDTTQPTPINAPTVVTEAKPDPNAPPIPVRVSQQARTAALAATAAQRTVAQATNRITTGSIGQRQTSAPKPTERAPSSLAGTQQTTEPNAPSQPALDNTASANTAALRLATAPSLVSLRQSWAVLVDRHRAILQGLSPRYRDITSAAGRSFQLIAGPLLSRGEAIQLCAMLQVRSVSCGVDSYQGTPL